MGRTKTGTNTKTKKPKVRKPFVSNLGDRIKRQMPPGVESRVYRVQAPEPALAKWEGMTPKERGNLIVQAFGHPTPLKRP